MAAFCGQNVGICINECFISICLWLLVPEDFEEDNYTGHRGDKFHRMELRKSSVEFIAPSEYMVSAVGAHSRFSLEQRRGRGGVGGRGCV